MCSHTFLFDKWAVKLLQFRKITAHVGEYGSLCWTIIAVSLLVLYHQLIECRCRLAPLFAAVPDAFELSTERRARERQEYERAVMENEAMRAMIEEKWKREEEQKDKEEIARLRQEQVS